MQASKIQLHHKTYAVQLRKGKVYEYRCEHGNADGVLDRDILVSAQVRRIVTNRTENGPNGFEQWCEIQSTDQELHGGTFCLVGEIDPNDILGDYNEHQELVKKQEEEHRRLQLEEQHRAELLAMLYLHLRRAGLVKTAARMRSVRRYSSPPAVDMSLPRVQQEDLMPLLAALEHLHDGKSYSREQVASVLDATWLPDSQSS